MLIIDLHEERFNSLVVGFRQNSAKSNSVVTFIQSSESKPIQKLGKYGTVLWEMFVVEYFCGTGKPRKLNTQISVYSIHFVCVIIMGCHEPQKYFNRNVLHARIFHTKFSQITVFMVPEEGVMPR